MSVSEKDLRAKAERAQRAAEAAQAKVREIEEAKEREEERRQAVRVQAFADFEGGDGPRLAGHERQVQRPRAGGD